MLFDLKLYFKLYLHWDIDSNVLAENVYFFSHIRIIFLYSVIYNRNITILSTQYLFNILNFVFLCYGGNTTL